MLPPGRAERLLSDEQDKGRGEVAHFDAVGAEVRAQDHRGGQRRKEAREADWVVGSPRGSLAFSLRHETVVNFRNVTLGSHTQSKTYRSTQQSVRCSFLVDDSQRREFLGTEFTRSLGHP